MERCAGREREGGWTYFDDDDRFLDNIADFRGDQIEQYVDATFSGSVNLDSALTDRSDSSLDEFDVDF